MGKGDFEIMSNRIDSREVEFSGKFGFINDSGKEIFPPVFDMVISMFSDYAIVGEGVGALHYMNFPEEKSYSFSGASGVVSKTGSIILPLRYHSVQRIDHPEIVFWFVKEDTISCLFRDTVNLSIQKNIQQHTTNSCLMLSNKCSVQLK